MGSCKGTSMQQERKKFRGSPILKPSNGHRSLKTRGIAAHPSESRSCLEIHCERLGQQNIQRYPKLRVYITTRLVLRIAWPQGQVPTVGVLSARGVTLLQFLKLRPWYVVGIPNSWQRHTDLSGHFSRSQIAVEFANYVESTYNHSSSISCF